MSDAGDRAIEIDLNPFLIQGNVRAPPSAPGLVLMAAGSGVSRSRGRLRHARGIFTERGLATAAFDLFSRDETIVEEESALDVEAVGLLAGRIVVALDHLAAREAPRLPIALFAFGGAAAAALLAASERGAGVAALVMLDAELGAAQVVLSVVTVPTLMLVCRGDELRRGVHERALARLGASTKSLFPCEPSLPQKTALDQALAFAAGWLVDRFAVVP